VNALDEADEVGWGVGDTYRETASEGKDKERLEERK
jgi:hypothetical protein